MYVAYISGAVTPFNEISPFFRSLFTCKVPGTDSGIRAWHHKNMKILMTGGGTLGPVTPLLAIVEEWRALREDTEFVWVGTKSGPERKIIEDLYHIPFHAIQVARIPRYISREWFLFPFRFCLAFFQSLQLLQQEKPTVIVGAGGYTQVPLMFAAQLFRVPCVVLQPDVDPLLSNRLVAGLAKRIFVAWKKTAIAFPAHKTMVTGNPVRSSLLNGSKERAMKQFDLNPDKPTLLVFGGGTGAMWLNAQLGKIIPSIIEKMNVIHVTGVGKGMEISKRKTGELGKYIVRETLEEMNDVYAVADIVVGRAGMGTITEIVALKKPSILIPLHASQQHNADALEGAIVVLQQDTTTSEGLASAIINLMENTLGQRQFAEQLVDVLPTSHADLIIQEIKKTLHEKRLF